jgi:acyl carrier protein
VTPKLVVIAALLYLSPSRLERSNGVPAGRVGQGLESEMDEVATKIIEILKKHMKEPRDDISLSTALTDLKIESLDLAMIVFDIEDTFGIEIPYNANEDVGDFKTVGSVVDKVKGLMAAGPAAAKA